jgi:hypothetical protein
MLKSARKSTRGLPIIELNVVIAGRGNPTTIQYGKQILTDKQIEESVDKIKEAGGGGGGYQIVCLPMPPDESHSIVVDMTQDGVVMIADWGGEKNRSLKSKKWVNYVKFIHHLERAFIDRCVKYYPIDDELFERAYERCEENHGQGGCSAYVHSWIEKYIAKESFAVTFPALFH